MDSEKEIMYFKDEEGNKVAFEAVARIFLDEETENEKEYLILSPVDGNEDDAFVFRVDYPNESQELNLVEDDKEFERVKKEYKGLLYNDK